MIPRLLQTTIVDRLLHDTRAVIVYGARQVGKTTLINRVLDELPYRTLRITADSALVPDALSSRDLSRLRGMTQGYDALFLDEAQRVPDVGIDIKLMVDHLPGLRIIATGFFDARPRRPHSGIAGRACLLETYPESTFDVVTPENFFAQERL